MVFDTLNQNPPVKVRHLRIVLDFYADSTEQYQGKYHFVLVDADGNRVPDPLQSGDLLPHLSDQEKIALKDFMDDQLLKVEGRLA